jgi:hypothetical protein
LRETFPNLSDAKLKEDIFSGSQIREIIDDDLSELLMVESEKSAWLTFKAFCLSFFGNVKAENYKEIVEELLNACQTVGCHMSLKIHILYYRLDFSLRKREQGATNMGKVSTRIFPT